MPRPSPRGALQAEGMDRRDGSEAVGLPALGGDLGQDLVVLNPTETVSQLPGDLLLDPQGDVS